MPRKKKVEQPIGVGLTTKQIKRKKPINTDYLVDINPLTDNQQRLFDSYKEQKHLIAYGVAGTGEVGEWKDKLVNKNPGWNEVLKKASRAPGSRVKPIK